MGLHFGRFDLVCHPLLLGHHHGPGLPGHEQCPGGAPPDRRRRLFWASGPPGGPKTPGYHRWICHAFPDFDGSHVNWFSWGHCCGLYHNLWYLPGTISRDFLMSVWTRGYCSWRALVHKTIHSSYLWLFSFGVMLLAHFTYSFLVLYIQSCA